MGPEMEVSLGIDLGGTSTRVGLYDRDMQILGSATMPTRVEAGPRAAVQDMAEAIRSLLAVDRPQGAAPRARGVGIGSPGPINLRTGVLGLLPNLPGWEQFPLRNALAEATGLPVVLESDANAAALAEWRLGAGQGTGLRSMAMITLGTGVGSGLILNGEVWHGMYGMGGEVGHASVDPEGLPCPCGSRGCLEMYASANGLIRLARAEAATAGASEGLRDLAAGGGLTPLAVAQLAAAGCRASQQAYRRLGAYLGIGIANLTSTLDLPMVVVGGGVASAWELFAPAMFEALRAYSVVYRLAEPSQRESPEPDRTFVCPARLGPAAGLMGAALLPWLTRD